MVKIIALLPLHSGHLVDKLKQFMIVHGCILLFYIINGTLYHKLETYFSFYVYTISRPV